MPGHVRVARVPRIRGNGGTELTIAFDSATASPRRALWRPSERGHRPSAGRCAPGPSGRKRCRRRPPQCRRSRLLPTLGLTVRQSGVLSAERAATVSPPTSRPRDVRLRLRGTIHRLRSPGTATTGVDLPRGPLSAADARLSRAGPRVGKEYLSLTSRAVSSKATETPFTRGIRP